MPTHGKPQTASCQPAPGSFSLTHTHIHTSCSLWALALKNRLKRSLIKQRQHPTWSILRHFGASRTIKIPASYDSSLILHVLKARWQQQCLSMWHASCNVCVQFLHIRLHTCMNAYDISSSPGLSAWIFLCLFLTSRAFALGRGQLCCCCYQTFEFKMSFFLQTLGSLSGFWSPEESWQNFFFFF